MALVLQAHDGVSDEEAKARADFDPRWKAALGIGLEERPFAKSTLQLFRARLIIHERVRTLFERSLAFARRTGYFRSRKKSASKRFDGHKAQVAVDPESQLITAAEVMAGNAPDHERALQMVEQVEANVSVTVEEAVGDCAYGDGDTRRILPDGSSPRPGGNWWPRWPQGAEGPSSPKRTSGSIWRR
jgi:hypothetical protein